MRTEATACAGGWKRTQPTSQIIAYVHTFMRQGLRGAGIRQGAASGFVSARVNGTLLQSPQVTYQRSDRAQTSTSHHSYSYQHVVCTTSVQSIDNTVIRSSDVWHVFVPVTWHRQRHNQARDCILKRHRCAQHIFKTYEGNGKPVRCLYRTYHA